MPRTKTKGELWRRLDFLYILRDGGTGDTTVNSAASKGDLTVTIASGTGFADSDRIRVGSEDKIEEHVIASGGGTTTLTLQTELHRDHAVGDAVVERVQTDLGHLTDDGVTLTSPGDHNAVNIGTRTLAWAYLIGHTEFSTEFSLASWNLENIATAFAIPESLILGAGSSTDPYRVVLDPEDYATDLNLSFAFEGILLSGDTVRGEIWGAEVDVTALNATLARATAATPLGMRARATSGGALYIWT
jgi:hypothetical protein